MYIDGVPNVLSSQIISTVTSTVVRSFNIMSRISSTTINNNTFADNGGLSVVSWALAAVMFVVVIMCMVIVMVVVIMWKRKVEAIKENSTRSGEEASSNTGLTHDYGMYVNVLLIYLRNYNAKMREGNSLNADICLSLF